MIGPVLRKELTTLWASPLPYVTGAVFHAALGLLAVDTMQARQQATFQPVVPIAGFLVLIAVPVLTMRVLADERRTGTLDVLLAVPVRPLPLVVGKWLAVLSTVVVLLAPVGFHVLLLGWWGEPDPGPVLAGAVGLVLLAGAAVAVGVIASSLTSSQAVAALASSFVLLLGWFIIRETIERASGSGSSIDTSNFVSRSLFDAQVEATHDSFSNSDDGITDSLAESVSTDLLTVTGNGTVSGAFDVTGVLTSSAYFSAPYLTAADATATSTMSGALAVGTTTGKDTLTVAGPAYLASISPTQATNRLYNQYGSLYSALPRLNCC